MSWHDLETDNSDLAAFGWERLSGRVAYLATVRADGRPRVHPVTPIIGQGRLFLFMEPTSPKGHDLRRGSGYALHASVEDSDGGRGEFYVAGAGHFTDDPTDRALATELSSYRPAPRYILFELTVEEAFATIYDKEGRPERRRWRRK